MANLNNKIDFVAIVAVNGANPNGDPLNGNRPRTNYDGLGEISDVCIKRKIRNRMQDMGHKIFVQSDDRSDDGCTSLKERVDKESFDKKNKEEFYKKACQIWLDVRSFGQVFAFKGSGDKGAGVSVGVRGPVSVHQAVSVSPIDVVPMQITKSVSGEKSNDSERSSDTMGMKHYAKFGAYVVKGSINVQLAEKTGFSEEDANVIKESLRTLFRNDSSSARPEGSMEVVKLYWFRHNCRDGQYSSAQVHRSVKVKARKDNPASMDDYEITIEPLEGLEPEIVAGE